MRATGQTMEVTSSVGVAYRLTRAGYLYRDGKRLGKVLTKSLPAAMAAMRDEPLFGPPNVDDERAQGNNFHLIHYVIGGSSAGFGSQYIPVRSQ